MISLPNPTNKMTLTQDQLYKLTLMYAERVVDNMDMRDLCALAIDTIVDNMNDYKESELMEELSHYYDDDELQELVESVTQESWIKVTHLQSVLVVWALTTMPKLTTNEVFAKLKVTDFSVFEKPGKNVEKN